MNKRIAFCLLLACALVTGFVWAMAHSLTSIGKIGNPAVSQPIETDASKSQIEMLHSADEKAPVPKQASGAITKCIVNGKTIYSDTQCNDNKTAKAVSMNETAGIVSPSKELVAETMFRGEQERRIEEYRRSGYAKVASIGKSEEIKQECEYLKKRIEQIEAEARMPQSGQTQDALSAEKRTLQTQQNSLRC